MRVCGGGSWPAYPYNTIRCAQCIWYTNTVCTVCMVCILMICIYVCIYSDVFREYISCWVVLHTDMCWVYTVFSMSHLSYFPLYRPLSCTSLRWSPPSYRAATAASAACWVVNNGFRYRCRFCLARIFRLTCALLQISKQMYAYPILYVIVVICVRVVHVYVIT